LWEEVLVKLKKMLYIELKSKIAEEAGEGHTIMTIYDGDLVRAPLSSRPQDRDFLQIANVSRAFIAYHPVKESQAKVLMGIVKRDRTEFPDPTLYPHKKVDWCRLMPYFDQLSDPRTEEQLSMPEFKLFARCQDLEKELSDVPYPEPIDI